MERSSSMLYVDGTGRDGMVIIGHRSSKSTFGANIIRYAQYMLSQSGIIWQNLKNISQWVTHFPTWIQEMLAHLERARGGHARKSWSINFFVQIFYERELEKGMCEKVDQLTQLCYRSLAATWAHSMMGGEIEMPINNDPKWSLLTMIKVVH